MYTIPQILSFLAGLLINLGLVYATYLIYTRKQCSKLLMLKAAAIVAGGTAIIAALTRFLPEYLGGLPLITDLMLIYHCARTILKVERKPAFLCTITYFGIVMLLGFGLAMLLAAFMVAA